MHSVRTEKTNCYPASVRIRLWRFAVQTFLPRALMICSLGFLFQSSAAIGQVSKASYASTQVMIALIAYLMQPISWYADYCHTYPTGITEEPPTFHLQLVSRPALSRDLHHCITHCLLSIHLYQQRQRLQYYYTYILHPEPSTICQT